MATFVLPPRYEALLRLILTAGTPVAPGTMEKSLQASRPTLNRALRDLLASGLLEKRGNGCSTRYVATDAAKAALGSELAGSPPLHQQTVAQW
jgi:predicted HTH transcriptional regulator